MSLQQQCERCGGRENVWLMQVATLHVGEIYRETRLCPACLKRLQEAITIVLPPMVPKYEGLP